MVTFSSDFEKALEAILERTIQQTISQLLLLEQKKVKEAPSIKYLTKKQVCDCLNISLSALNNYLRAKKIPKHIIGGRVLIKQSDIENL